MPDQAGMYPLELEFSDTTQTFGNLYMFVKVTAQKFKHFIASSEVKNVNTESIYNLNFAIPTTGPFPLASSGSLHSKIIIEFPRFIQGNRVFEDNLGGYQGQGN